MPQPGWEWAQYAKHDDGMMTMADMVSATTTISDEVEHQFMNRMSVCAALTIPQSFRRYHCHNDFSVRDVVLVCFKLFCWRRFYWMCECVFQAKNRKRYEGGLKNYAKELFFIHCSLSLSHDTFQHIRSGSGSVAVNFFCTNYKDIILRKREILTVLLQFIILPE